MDTKAESLFSGKLKSSGRSLTAARLAVFRLLLKYSPLSMAELIKKSQNSFDRVTLYRTIDLFDELDITHKVYMGWKYKIELSDSFLNHHHHISCIGCHNIIAVEENNKLEELISAITTANGFKLSTHQLEIQGLCASCQQKAESKTNPPVSNRRRR